MMTAASDGGDGGLSRGAWAGRIVGAAVAGVAVAAQVGGTANERSNRRRGVIPSRSGIFSDTIKPGGCGTLQQTWMHVQYVANT